MFIISLPLLIRWVFLFYDRLKKIKQSIFYRTVYVRCSALFVFLIYSGRFLIDSNRLFTFQNTIKMYDIWLQYYWRVLKSKRKAVWVTCSSKQYSLIHSVLCWKAIMVTKCEKSQHGSLAGCAAAFWAINIWIL